MTATPKTLKEIAWELFDTLTHHKKFDSWSEWKKKHHELIAQSLTSYGNQRAAEELEDQAIRLEHLREAQSDSDLILLRQIVLNLRIRANEIREGKCE